MTLTTSYSTHNVGGVMTDPLPTPRIIRGGEQVIPPPLTSRTYTDQLEQDVLDHECWVARLCARVKYLEQRLDRVDQEAAQLRSIMLQPPRETSRAGDGWALDRNTLQLTVADSRIRLTPQESRLLAALADAGGYFVTAAQIGAAVGISVNAVRTNFTRIRDKFAAAGVDFGAVVENSRGAGYRARMANRTEVSA